MQSSEEGFGELVIAGGDAAEVFELIEEALDAVALTVELFVEGQAATARRERRDGRFNFFITEAFSNAIGVVS